MTPTLEFLATTIIAAEFARVPGTSRATNALIRPGIPTILLIQKIIFRLALAGNSITVRRGQTDGFDGGRGKTTI